MFDPETATTYEMGAHAATEDYERSGFSVMAADDIPRDAYDLIYRYGGGDLPYSIRRYVQGYNEEMERLAAHTAMIS